MNPTPPSPIQKPKLATFIWSRDIELRQVAAAIGCSHEQVRLMCLPFGNPRRRVPSEALMARIVEWTGGEIRPSDFYPPDLNGHARAAVSQRAAAE